MSGADQYCGKYNCYIKHGYFSFLPQVNAGHNIKCINCIFIFHVGCDLKQELHMVKAKVYTEFITKKETHLYEPDTFREFFYFCRSYKVI